MTATDPAGGRPARKARAKRRGVSRGAKARWEAKTLGPTLERAPERSGEFATASGIPVERVYTSGGDSDIGFPGA